MKEYVLYKKHTTPSATTTELRAWREATFVQKFDKIKKVTI